MLTRELKLGSTSEKINFSTYVVLSIHYLERHVPCKYHCRRDQNKATSNDYRFTPFSLSDDNIPSVYI